MGLMHPMFDHVGKGKRGKKLVRKEIHEKQINRWEKWKPTDAELLAIQRSEYAVREQTCEPGIKILITPMEDKDLAGWNTPANKKVGEIPEGLCIAPTYNKRAYQVVPKDDTDAYRNRK